MVGSSCTHAWPSSMSDTKRERPAVDFAHFTARGRKCHQKNSLEIILEAPRKSMTNSMCSHRADHMERITMIESISAVTLATHNMPHAVRFTACWDLRSFTETTTQRLLAFGWEPAFSI